MERSAAPPTESPVSFATPGVRKPRAESAVYRRRIVLRAPEAGLVIGDLADDPHHFRVTLRHDGERVTDVVGEAIRFPWTTCPGASEPIRALIGMALSPAATAVGAQTDARSNCTHMFDLAGLCVALAGSGRVQRRYDCAVRDGENGRTLASVARDGERVVEWVLEGEIIQAPERYAGVHVHRQFMKWTQQHLDAEEAEAAIVLRRACFVAPTRKFDLDALTNARQLSRGVALCHSFQEANVDRARRVQGMQCDFTQEPRDLLQISETIGSAARGACSDLFVGGA